MRHTYKSLLVIALLIVSATHTWGQCTGGCTRFNESPINIATRNVTTCPGNPLSLNFPAASSNFMVSYVPSNGHGNVKITPAGASVNKVSFNGSGYTLSEIHAHAVAEHAIDSTRSAYELHFVFSKTSGTGSEKLVIGMWGNYMAAPMPSTYTDTVTTKAVAYITAVGVLACSGFPVPLPMSMSLHNYETNGLLNEYYTYCGSLTTGTHDKVVTWIVCSKPVNAYTEDAVNTLKSDVCPGIIEGARGLQPVTVPVYVVGKK